MSAATGNFDTLQQFVEENSDNYWEFEKTESFRFRRKSLGRNVSLLNFQ